MKLFRFVTYCTSDYLIYAINAVESALKNHPNSKGNIVCVNPLPKDFNLINDNLELHEIKNIPIAQNAFTNARKNRNELEALISIKPTILINFFHGLKESEILIYLDTDIFFFESLNNFEAQYPEVDFMAFQHMYSIEPLHFPYGKYNAGLLVIRKTLESLTILQEWERLCMEWCYLIKDKNRFADQGYLEQLLTMPRGRGINSSTINIGMHYLWKGPKVSVLNGKPCIAGTPLVAFHFHGMVIRGEFLWTGLNRYGFKITNLSIYKIIYKPVITEILKYRVLDTHSKLATKPNPLILHNFIIVIRRMKKTIVKVPQPKKRLRKLKSL